MLGIGDEISIFCRRYWRAILYFWFIRAFRVFRRLIKTRSVFRFLEDFFFWYGQVCICLSRSMTLVDGSIRWFFTIGVVVGGVCSFFVLHFLSEMGKKLFARIREKDEKSIDKSKGKR